MRAYGQIRRLFEIGLEHEVGHEKISDLQHSAHFRKSQKVLYQSTIVYLQHYYTVSVIRGEAQAPVLLLIQLINTHTHPHAAVLASFH